jgi:hypothetical protein
VKSMTECVAHHFVAHHPGMPGVGQTQHTRFTIHHARSFGGGDRISRDGADTFWQTGHLSI